MIQARDMLAAGESRDMLARLFTGAAAGENQVSPIKLVCHKNAQKVCTSIIICHSHSYYGLLWEVSLERSRMLQIRVATKVKFAPYGLTLVTTTNPSPEPATN